MPLRDKLSGVFHKDDKNTTTTTTTTTTSANAAPVVGRSYELPAEVS